MEIITTIKKTIEDMEERIITKNQPKIMKMLRKQKRKIKTSKRNTFKKTMTIKNMMMKEIQKKRLTQTRTTIIEIKVEINIKKIIIKIITKILMAENMIIMLMKMETITDMKNIITMIIITIMKLSEMTMKLQLCKSEIK